jgi:hypothetical protein
MTEHLERGYTETVQFLDVRYKRWRQDNRVLHQKKIILTANTDLPVLKEVMVCRKWDLLITP